MVFLVKVDNEVIAVPGGAVELALAPYGTDVIDYAGVKRYLLGQKVDGGDNPYLNAPDDIGYLDFDQMEEQRLRWPVAIGMHIDLFRRHRKS